MSMLLAKIHSNNVAIALENLFLERGPIDAQKEILHILAGVAKIRSWEMLNHARRVAECCHHLALILGLSDNEAHILRMASPLHDVGKIGIPESILFKPAKLTAEEFETIKKHTEIGYDLFGKSLHEILKAASIISREHHENWDGTGYPDGLEGDDIHIFGQITRVTDVFDALCHKRVYKEAWSLPRVKRYLRVQKGKKFSPRVVEAFLDHSDEFIDLMREFSD